MAHFDLRTGEELIGKAAASNIRKFLFMPQPNPGNLIVTNQRVIFTPTQGRMSSAFEYELGALQSFSVGTGSAIKLKTADNQEIKISGMFNKKLIAALEQAGLTRN